MDRHLLCECAQTFTFEIFKRAKCTHWNLRIKKIVTTIFIIYAILYLKKRERTKENQEKISR